MKSKKTPKEKEESQLKNLRFLYIKGSPQAVKFARRQLVNVFGFDDDSSDADHDGQYQRGQNFN